MTEDKTTEPAAEDEREGVELPPALAEALAGMVNEIMGHAREALAPVVQIKMQHTDEPGVTYGMEVAARGFGNAETVMTFLLDFVVAGNRLNPEEYEGILNTIETARKREGLRSLEDYAWTNEPDPKPEPVPTES